MIRKHLITALIFLLVASLYSMWRENCLSGCVFERVVVGWPVFLRTPFSPDASGGPQFYFLALLGNIGWSLGAAVIVWAVASTFARWQDRRPPPELPGLE